MTLKMSQPLNLLFVCSRNKWRSPTGETLYRRDPRVQVRSAGLATSAKRRLKTEDLNWADVTLVMSEDQASRVKQMLRKHSCQTTIYVLDIPDEYQYMDPELVEILSGKVEAILTT